MAAIEVVRDLRVVERVDAAIAVNEMWMAAVATTQVQPEAVTNGLVVIRLPHVDKVHKRIVHLWHHRRTNGLVVKRHPSSKDSRQMLRAVVVGVAVALPITKCTMMMLNRW